MKKHRLTRREFIGRTALGASGLSVFGSQANADDRRTISPEHEPIAAVVEKHTGRTATSVEELKWFHAYGDSNGTSYSVRCGKREYIVRVPRQARKWPLGDLGSEADYHAVIGKYVCTGLREQRLGAPIVYAVDRDCDILDRPCAVASRVPGRPWRYYEDLWRKHRITSPPAHGREMGRLVRGIHEIRPRRGFGPVTDDGVGLVDSWSDMIHTLFNTWAEKAFRRRAISEEQRSLADAVIDKWASQCDPTAGRILWMDDIMFGALVDAERRAVTGVSHAVGAWSGDPDYELEWFAYYREDTDSLTSPPEEFAEGYGRRYDEVSDKRRFYRMSIYLCKLTWLDMKTERAKQHRERLDRILRQLV